MLEGEEYFDTVLGQEDDREDSLDPGMIYNQERLNCGDVAQMDRAAAS